MQADAFSVLRAKVLQLHQVVRTLYKYVLIGALPERPSVLRGRRVSSPSRYVAEQLLPQELPLCAGCGGCMEANMGTLIGKLEDLGPLKREGLSTK